MGLIWQSRFLDHPSGGVTRSTATGPPGLGSSSNTGVPKADDGSGVISSSRYHRIHPNSDRIQAMTDLTNSSVAHPYFLHASNVKLVSGNS
jgi:hypothetical protein